MDYTREAMKRGESMELQKKEEVRTFLSGNYGVVLFFLVMLIPASVLYAQTSKTTQSTPSQTTETKPLLDMKPVESKAPYETLKESIEKSLKNALSENLRLNVEIEVLRKKLSDLESYARAITGMNNTLQDENNTLRGVRDELDNARATIGGLQNKITLLDEEKRAVDMQLKELKARIEELTKRNDELTALLEGNAIEQENRKIKEQIAVLEKQLNGALAEMSRMGTERESFAQECALLRYNLGYFFFREKDYKRAAEEFERSVKLNPKNMDAFYNLGIIYDEYLNKDAEAVINYKKYLVLLGEQEPPKGKEDQQKATDLKNKVQNKLLQAELREKSKIDSPIDQTLR